MLLRRTFQISAAKLENFMVRESPKRVSIDDSYRDTPGLYAFSGRVYALRHGVVYTKQGRESAMADSIARADESARVLAFPCTGANMRYSIVR